MRRTKPFVFSAPRGGFLPSTNGTLCVRLVSGQEISIPVMRGSVFPFAIAAVLPGTTAHGSYFADMHGVVYATDTIKHLALGHPG